jgi:transcription-repair coupling factor (superfamily II helicase)
LSTSIVESGLDIPRANTLIVHRADMFGLGAALSVARPGRALEDRAYAIFTTPANKPITPQAEKRLKVLQSLDTLGAGFQLASHDLDLRGAGNLLGEEQSGHIKEVGYELYQQMVQDAVERLKSGDDEPAQDMWSPTISLGSAGDDPRKLHPRSADAALALPPPVVALRRAEIEAMGAEIVDRFGPPPPEVDLLLKLVRIKALCRRAHVEKLDAGAEGHDARLPRQFLRQPDRAGEVGDRARRSRGCGRTCGSWSSGDFEELKDRLDGALKVMREIAKIAGKKG